MGYTHYWRRKKEIPFKTMQEIIDDFIVVLPVLLEVIDLAGPSSAGSPCITYNAVSFNGRTRCGHPKQKLGVLWPTQEASGIANPFKEDAVEGSWFAGALINKRSCDGDCSHESFHFPRIMKIEDWHREENNLYFEFCKTAFKPYDLAVTVFLIIAKHHLKDDLMVTSDGSSKHWRDAKELCQAILEYDGDFKFDVFCLTAIKDLVK